MAAQPFRERPHDSRDAAGRDRSVRQDHILRAGLVGFGATILSIALSELWPIPAFIVYAAALWMQGWLLSAGTRFDPKVLRLITLTADISRIGILSVSAVLLWSDPSVIGQIGGLSLMISMIVHKLTSGRTESTLGVIEEIVMAGVIITFGLLMLPEPGLNTQTLLALVLTGLLITYTALSTRTSRRLILRYRAVERAAVSNRSLDAVGRLTSGVAHDFNNLLTVIIGNLDLHASARSTTEQTEAVAAAREAAQRGAVLVSQLLSFARQAPMAPERIELKPYFEGLRQITARLSPVHTSVQFVVRPGGDHIHVDRNLLTTALVNLLVNARDAMPKGGLIIVETAPFDIAPGSDWVANGLTPGRYTRIDVYDEGHGIAAAHLSKVTEPFFTTKKFGESAGLGLSVVLGFAEQSGGALRIDSTEGRGTHVTLILPKEAVKLKVKPASPVAPEPPEHDKTRPI